MGAFLILNNDAGSVNGDRDTVPASAIVQAFREEGTQVQLRPAAPAQLLETLRAAVAARPDAIFVGGGDGTISTAATVLTDSNIPLGVLPLGTLNHFARDLGLPTDWREAVSVLARGQVRTVDVGEVNEHVFINNCSIGSYAEAVRKRDALRELHGKGKWWAMTLATLTVFRRLRRLRLQIETREATTALRAPFVFIGNNRYSGRVLDSSLRPRLDEGRLWIYTTRARRRGTILRYAWQTLLRNIDEVDGLEVYETEAATISHHYGRLSVAVDGELITLDPPLRFRIRSRALRVIAPPTAGPSPQSAAIETPALSSHE